MQSSQQSPNNSQQQYEVCQIQPINLHQTYNSQYPPLNYQQTNLQQMYNSHCFPLPLLRNAKQAIVRTQSESDENLEHEECSDKETQEPLHEWQSVDKTKKMKRELTRKNEDKTKQTYITTSNRFETLAHKMEATAMNKPNQIHNSHPNHILYLYMMFSITRI